MIQDRIASVINNIVEVCERCGRKPEDITVVGVTKYANVEQIAEGIDAGIEHIGENRVQDALEKFELLSFMGKKATKHMIGHLQSNKVKTAVELFDIIESVDSVKLISTIETCARNIGKKIEILIQVNISGEEQKNGCSVDDLESIIKKAKEFEFARVVGLMAMAPLTEDKEKIRGCFASLRELKEKLAEKYGGYSNIDLKHLSMGMSSDYEIAIQEGSDMIRIGRAIFQDE